MAIVRVLRLLEYVGEREMVESALQRSIKGTLLVPGAKHGDRVGLIIRAATLGDFPEIMTDEQVQSVDAWVEEKMKAGLAARESAERVGRGR